MSSSMSGYYDDEPDVMQITQVFWAIYGLIAGIPAITFGVVGLVFWTQASSADIQACAENYMQIWLGMGITFAIIGFCSLIVIVSGFCVSQANPATCLPLLNCCIFSNILQIVLVVVPCQFIVFVLAIVGSVRTWSSVLMTETCRATTLWARNNAFYIAYWSVFGVSVVVVGVLLCVIGFVVIPAMISNSDRETRPSDLFTVRRAYQRVPTRDTDGDRFPTEDHDGDAVIVIERARLQRKSQVARQQAAAAAAAAAAQSPQTSEADTLQSYQSL